MERKRMVQDAKQIERLLERMYHYSDAHSMGQIIRYLEKQLRQELKK